MAVAISAPVVHGSASVIACAPSPLRLMSILRRLGGSETAAPAPLTLFPATLESLLWSALERINWEAAPITLSTKFDAAGFMLRLSKTSAGALFCLTVILN